MKININLALALIFLITSWAIIFKKKENYSSPYYLLYYRDPVMFFKLQQDRVNMERMQKEHMKRQKELRK